MFTPMACIDLQGQHYAMIADLEKPTSNLVLDDLQKTVYSEIKQPQAHTTPSKLLEVNSCGPEEPCHSPNNSTATGESCSCVTKDSSFIFSCVCSICVYSVYKQQSKDSTHADCR